MLSKLSISNYALIENIEIDFNEGLSIITGETGAGKSIILGALSLILGDRVDLKVIRNSDKKAIIETVFDISKFELKSFFEENNLDWNDKELILRREITPNSRSRAFVNDTPVNLQKLRELSIRLIDIHSQYQNLLLADSKYQLQIIDAIADNEELRKDYRKQFKKYVELVTRLRKIRELVSQSREEEEYLRFQYEQLKKLNLKIGEISELEKQYEILNSAEELRTILSDATYKLMQTDDSVLSMLKETSKSLSQLNFSLFEESESSGDSLIQRMDSVYVELKDISETIEQYLSKVNADPVLLEKIDVRLNTLYDAQRRFNVSSELELIKYKDDIEDKLMSVDNSDDMISKLDKDVKTEGKILKSLAGKLSDSRLKAAELFSNLLMDMARPLGMNNINFDVKMLTGKLNYEGQDIIEFLCSFNKNQKMLPISKVASGGEMSRIMLCVKTIVANKIQLPTIIFDEVDSGVSGEVANKMGDMMKKISENIQVLTITHLPQVAAKGDNHYKVYKTDSEESTYTNIQMLSNDDRIQEIAQMLSGSKVDTAAVMNAKSLLQN